MRGMKTNAERRQLGLPEQEVEHPAAPHVGAWPAEVADDVHVRATGILQGVGQDRQSVEGPPLVG